MLLLSKICLTENRRFWIMAKEKGANKTHGRIYTPDYIVYNIFDLAGYRGEKILKKHVIDNSCGDGAFLTLIVKEYCEEYLKLSDDLATLKKELEKYIHGIELDDEEAFKCKENMKTVALSFGVEFEPDVLCANTLDVHKFDGKMDYVLGNPPYVRVHNLGDSYTQIKTFKFAEGGMTDLYITFYEVGLNMLNKNGVLSYIAPSSWFTSVAGGNMRKYLQDNNLIASICDLKHFQPFNATTYTCITTLSYKENKKIKYHLYDGELCKPVHLVDLTYKDINIEDSFYFATKEELKTLKKIIGTFVLGNEVEVKNGFATLADDIFISNKFDFKSKWIIPCYKASTAQWKECIFPYKNGKLISIEELKQDRLLFEYFSSNEEIMSKRSLDKGTLWFGFGRSQGINDVAKERIGINALLRDVSDIKTEIIKPGRGIYSGLYILTTIPSETIIRYIKSDEFVKYISLLGKYKSGGYYTFSSKDIKKFLVYKISEDGING